MKNVSQSVNKPIRSLQHYLRKLSRVYDDIPPVIPDGRYGPQTANAVSAFQLRFGLPVTGSVSSESWDRIIQEYLAIEDELAPPAYAKLYPSSEYQILPNHSDDFVYIVQSIMYPMTKIFENIGNVNINGKNDMDMQDCVKRLQHCFGMEQNGIVDKNFWNMLVSLYDAVILETEFNYRT